MNIDFIPALTKHLLRGQVQEAVDLLVPWLHDHGATTGAIAGLLAVCPAVVYQNLITLLADILTGYPSIIVAVPVLFYAVPEHRRRFPESFLLPAVGNEPLQEAEHGLRFNGWAPIDTILPEIWVNCRQRRVEAQTWQICGAAAVFQSELMPDELPPSVLLEWWGNLFLRTGHCVSMSTGGLVLPYPAAVEAVRIMLAASQDPGHTENIENEPYDDRRFLDIADQVRAMRAGRDFGQSIRGQDTVIG